MPARRTRQQAMYNTPTLRNGGFGALQVEAVTNRPLSIARRHLAASQLRIRDIEPDQLTSSEWVRFLVMDERERDRWMGDFNRRRRRGSDESSNDSSVGSSSSADADAEAGRGSAAQGRYDKAEEARQEAEEAAEYADTNVPPAIPTATTTPSFLALEGRRSPPPSSSTTGQSGSVITRGGRTPSVSIWARQFDQRNDSEASPTVYSAWRPRHARRAVTAEGMADPPPTYESAVRSPPAYEAASAVAPFPSTVPR